MPESVRAPGLCCLLAFWAVCACGSPADGSYDPSDRLPLAAIVPGATETQPFGCTDLALEPFDPFCAGKHFHTGIDLAAMQGTPVHAAAGGVARIAFDQNGAGLYLIVTLDATTRVLYCHLSAIHVADKEDVWAGEVIGEVGSTGLSTGAHLHLEVQVNGRSVDPAVWLAP